MAITRSVRWYVFLEPPSSQIVVPRFASFPGQGGASTARYIASHLPSRICATLDRVLSSVLYGRTDRQSMLRKSGLISLELRRCIEELDNELGHVVQTVCPDPAHLSEAEADKIVAEYGDVLWRACAGTTLAAALVCLDHKLMWTFNVGNSTVGQSCGLVLGRLAARLIHA